MGVLKAIAQNYTNKPQLIMTTEYEKILNLLELRGAKVEDLRQYFASPSAEERLALAAKDPFYSGYKFSDDGEGYEMQSPEEYEVIKIEGALSYKPVTQLCSPETVNYQELVKTVEAIAEAGKKKIFFIHNSGGGEAYNLFATAREIRKIADDNAIELIGYVDGIAASASYGLLAICDEVIMNPDAEVGSVGVVYQLFNDSEALKKAGYKRVFVTAGAEKVPFDEEGNYKDSFLEGLKEQAELMYEDFLKHVADHRKEMTVGDVRKTEAKMFNADEAIKIGLADKQMLPKEFKEEYLITSDNNDQEIKMSKDKKVELTVEQQLAQLQEQLESKNAELSAFKAKEAEQARLAKEEGLKQELSQFTFLEDTDSLVAELMSDSLTKSTLVASLSQAQNSINLQESELSDLKANHTEEVAKLQEEVGKFKSEAEKAREDFALSGQVSNEANLSNVADSQEELNGKLGVQLLKQHKNIK